MATKVNAMIVANVNQVTVDAKPRFGDTLWVPFWPPRKTLASYLPDAAWGSSDES
jgi:hypothetical protein